MSETDEIASRGVVTRQRCKMNETLHKSIPMRVVYYLPKYKYFMERVRGRTSHAHGFLTGLTKNGTECVLASGPGYRDLYGGEDVKNVVFKPRHISRVNILWVMHSAFRLIRNKDLNRESTVLVVRYSTSVSILTSILFGLLWNGRTVYEVNSLGYHQSSSQSKAYLAVVLALERWLVSFFDVVICVSRNIEVDLKSANVEILVLPNGSSLPFVSLRSVSRDHVRFIYLGGFQPYYDYEQLFRCFLAADSKKAELHVYGDVEKYQREYPDTFRHNRIKFPGGYDLNALIRDNVLSKQDVFVLPNGRNRMARIGSPTKLFEYLAFGSRIIYQRYGQARDILEGLSSTFPYEDDRSLIRTLRMLEEKFNEPFSPPVTESEYVSTYTWEARVRCFLDFLSASSSDYSGHA